MMWMHWLLRLDDQYSGCAVLWFNQGGESQSRLELLVLV